MGFNGSGTFLINSSGQPYVDGTTATATVMNALTADLATGLTTVICKDGQTTTTARIVFAQGISSSLVTDTTSGTTGSIFTAGGLGVTKAIFTGTGIIYLTGTSATEASIRGSGTTVQIKKGDASGYAALEALTLFASGSIVYFGGGTSSEVQLNRSSTVLRARLGDDSDYAGFQAATIVARTGFVHFTGTTSSDLLLKNSGNTLLIRKGDDSAAGHLTVGNLTVTGTPSLNGTSGTFSTSVVVLNGVVVGGT